MKTSEMTKVLKKYVNDLANLFLERNTKYAGEEQWASNFNRNAELNRIYRIKEIIEEPYGNSIRYVIEKVDRLINGILLAKKTKIESGVYGLISYPQYKTIPDSIDDAIVYLFITKQLLIEEGFIEP